MRKFLLTLTVLAGTAGAMAAIQPAEAAPAGVGAPATVQTVQYYRPYGYGYGRGPGWHHHYVYHRWHRWGWHRWHHGPRF